MKKIKCDFSGWATKYGIKCSDGCTINQGAFKDQNGHYVTLCFQHSHTDPDNILGKALLESRPEGMYAYCMLNKSPKAETVKTAIAHGDLTSLSILANNLTRGDNNTVTHGIIRELSVVIAGANPEAVIEDIMAHGEIIDDEKDGKMLEMHLFNDANNIIEHADTEEVVVEGIEDDTPEGETTPKDNTAQDGKTIEHAASSEKTETVRDVLATFTEEQKKAFELSKELVTMSDDEIKEFINHASVESSDGKEKATLLEVIESLNKKQYYAFCCALGKHIAEKQEVTHSADLEREENTTMANQLDKAVNGADTTTVNSYISHSEFEAIINKSIANKSKSFKEDYLAHMATNKKTGLDPDVIMHAGITNIENLMPEAKLLPNQPRIHDIDDTYVGVLMAGVTHSPFQKVRSNYFDISADEARARGWVKDSETAKKEQTYVDLKREVDGQMIYTKQSFKRDDLIDLASFDAVAFAKKVMVKKWNQELTAAILVGDGRLPGDEDKIQETHIIPVAKDTSTYSIQVNLNADGATYSTVGKLCEALIDAHVTAQDDYEGNGNLTAFVRKDIVSQCLILKDGQGYRMYKSIDELATAMLVNRIVRVDKRIFNRVENLLAITFDMSDYNVGSNPKGEGTMFDDFDIDFNNYKYLFEGKASGALVAPYSALVFKGNFQQA